MSEHILFDDTFRLEIEKAVSHVRTSVIALSGYVKCAAISWLAGAIGKQAVPVSVVAGWSMTDLVSGASDANAYCMARDLGWRFGILPGLHAKIYIIDDEVFVGSANLTPRGLHLKRFANIEAGLRITPSNIDRSKLSALVAQAIWLNDRLFNEIHASVERAADDKDGNPGDLQWPTAIQERISEATTYLWVDDCLITTPTALARTRGADADHMVLVQHDWNLLGLVEAKWSSHDLQRSLRQTKIVRWLKEALTEEPDRSARFGRLSEKLHDRLLDDPKPYRRDVKILLANLIAWIEFANMPDFSITQHSHTKTIQLIERADVP